MAKQSVESLVEGGKATAAPPLGPALGPLGVNIGLVVAEINKKTADFKGMQVPVKVTVDSTTKAFEVTVGTPPASALIKKEALVEKGASNPLTDKVADLRIEQVIKIAKMKQDSLLGKDLKQRVKEVIGTCRSMGILVMGKAANEAIAEVNAGKFDAEIKAEKTEVSAEELKQLAEERKRLAADLAKRRTEYETRAKDIMAQLTGKTNREIRKALHDAKIPELIMNELCPEEKAVDPKAGGGKK